MIKTFRRWVFFLADDVRSRLLLNVIAVSWSKAKRKQINAASFGETVPNLLVVNTPFSSFQIPVTTRPPVWLTSSSPPHLFWLLWLFQELRFWRSQQIPVVPFSSQVAVTFRPQWFYLWTGWMLVTWCLDFMLSEKQAATFPPISHARFYPLTSCKTASPIFSLVKLKNTESFCMLACCFLYRVYFNQYWYNRHRSGD